MQPASERVAVSIAAAASVLAAPLAERGADAVEAVANELTVCLAELVREPLFHGLRPAFRIAELQALQIMLAAYEAELGGNSAQEPTPARSFYSAAIRWSSSEIAVLDVQRSATAGRRRRRKDQDEEGPQQAPRTQLQRRLAVEEAVLGELDLALGPVRLPERFLGLFLDQRPAGAGWFDAFALYVAGHVRADAGLQAALSAARLPALTELGVDPAGLLDQVFTRAKTTALRLEGRLAVADTVAPESADSENSEIAGFLDRLTADIAQRQAVPLPAVTALARIIGPASAESFNFEERLSAQVARLKSLLGLLGEAGLGGNAESRARQRAAQLLRDGKIAAAAAELSGLPESAPHARARGAVAGLLLRWDEAKAHLNRAIETVSPQRRAEALHAALELAAVLREESSEASLAAALAIYEALLGAADGDVIMAQRIDLAIRLAEVAVLVPTGASQLRCLTAASEHLTHLAQIRPLEPGVEARLLRARGDVDVALTAHGADRAREARAGYALALQAALAAGDLRLVSELHVALGVLAQQLAKSARPTEAAQLRADAMQAFKAAQVQRLRARDPLWWIEVKVHIAEAGLAIGNATGDAAALRAGAIAAKAAIRLLSAPAHRRRLSEVVTVLGHSFAALAKIEPTRAWREHALAAYREALELVDRSATPLRWSDIQIHIASQLLPDAEGSDADRLEQALECYRAAESVLRPQTARMGTVQRLLGDALLASGKRRLDPTRLQAATEAYRSAIECLPPESTFAQWCKSWIGLTEAERELARLKQDPSRLFGFIAQLEGAGERAAKIGTQWGIQSLSKALREARETAARIVSKSSVTATFDPAVKVARLLRQA